MYLFNDNQVHVTILKFLYENEITVRFFFIFQKLEKRNEFEYLRIAVYFMN